MTIFTSKHWKRLCSSAPRTSTMRTIDLRKNIVEVKAAFSIKNNGIKQFLPNVVTSELTTTISEIMIKHYLLALDLFLAALAGVAALA